jgi:SMI1-KNR4 cell-wall
MPVEIEKEVSRLGGVEPLENQFYPLNEDEIVRIEEAVAGKLPDDYKWLLRTYGEFLFANSVEFEPINENPEYCHPEELGVPNGAPFQGSGVSTFYGKKANNNSITVLKKVETFRDRMPEEFLPFADDGLGNQLCICLHEDNYQKIYWWDHEVEWDEEEYEEETGEPMPQAAKYQNVYLVANTMTEFFERLCISDAGQA